MEHILTESIASFTFSVKVFFTAKKEAARTDATCSMRMKSEQTMRQQEVSNYIETKLILIECPEIF